MADPTEAKDGGLDGVEGGIKPPPRTLLGVLAAIGPGIVVIGSVMGSGELINTPKQAAEFGFVLLWAVILSCVIKYFLQIEIGRHSLAHNRTPLQALNSLPFPKWRGTSWIGILFVVTSIPTSLAFAGMLGATGGVLHALLPFSDNAVLSSRIWMFLLAAVVLGLLWRDAYQEMEKLITVLVLGFSVSVVMGVFLIQGTKYQITAEQITSGLSFSLGDTPRLAGYAVISLMGALGATANELFMYPYWILEKGYPRFTGPPSSPGWTERTKGWIRILQIDVGFCTVLTTIITAAYFLMGAAVLYTMKDKPSGLTVVDEIAGMFTETYGDWSRIVFLLGAFCTLFSTMVVGLAAFGRMWGDALVSLRVVKGTERQLKKTHRWVELTYIVVLLPVAYLSENPAKNVIFAQFFAGLVCTPLLMIGICWMAFRTDKRVRMSRVSAFFLIASSIAIIVCVLVAQLGSMISKLGGS